MKRLSTIVLTAAFALLLASCGSVRPSKFYTLEIPSNPPVMEGAYPVTLLLGRLSAPHVYRDTRVVYRTGATEVGTYEYHRWAEPPPDMVEAVLMRMLRASGKFQSVQNQGSNARGDYIVRGRLHRFEEVNMSGLAARVALEFELYEQKSGTVVWSHFYTNDEPVNGKEVPAVVDALNRNVQRGLGEVVAGLDRYFASHKK